MRSLSLILMLLLAPFPMRAQQVAQSPTLQPGDLLRITIWREPDLSGEFQIEESGAVVLPLIGEIPAAGVTADALRDAVVSAYRSQLRNPSITVTPLRRVYVLGEVNRPGLLAVDPTVSLAGVIALAGGTNPVGDLRRIQIVRDGAPVIDGLSPTHLLTELDVRSGDQIVVGRRSWFDRNSTFVVSALLSVTSIIITLIR